MLFWFDWSEFMTFAIGDMKRTKSTGPRTEPWDTLVSMVVEGEDDESIFTKDKRLVLYEQIQEIT